MSDELKTKEVKETKAAETVEVVDEVEEVVQEAENVEVDKSSPFITEDDIFVVVVKYSKNGHKYLVEGIDEEFVNVLNPVSIKFDIKYPSQGDQEIINVQSAQMRSFRDSTELTLQDFKQLEVSRFLVLVRGWSLDEEINNEKILSLSPRIIQRVLDLVREEIETAGLI